jgi:hypothetical protein
MHVGFVGIGNREPMALNVHEVVARSAARSA